MAYWISKINSCATHAFITSAGRSVADVGTTASFCNSCAAVKYPKAKPNWPFSNLPRRSTQPRANRTDLFRRNCHFEWQCRRDVFWKKQRSGHYDPLRRDRLFSGPIRSLFVIWPIACARFGQFRPKWIRQSVNRWIWHPSRPRFHQGAPVQPATYNGRGSLRSLNDSSIYQHSTNRYLLRQLHVLRGFQQSQT